MNDTLELKIFCEIILKKGLTGKDLPRLSNEDDFHLIEISGITDIIKLKLFREKVLSSMFLGDLIRW